MFCYNTMYIQEINYNVRLLLFFGGLFIITYLPMILLFKLGRIIAKFIRRKLNLLARYILRRAYIYIFNVRLVMMYLGPMGLYVTLWFKYLYLFMVILVYTSIYRWFKSIYVFVDTMFYNLTQIRYYTYLYIFYIYVCVLRLKYIIYFKILLRYHYSFIKLYVYIMYILIYIINIK